MTRTRICMSAGLLLVALSLHGIGFHAANAAPGLRGFVIANGGETSTGPGLQFQGTAGQSVVGSSAGANHLLYHGFWSFGGPRVVGVDPPHVPGLPVELSIGPARPNPGRAAVRFALALPKDADVRLDVFDVAGRAAGEPVDRHFEAGYHDLGWQAPARAAGIFFARLSVEGRTVAQRKFVLVP